MKLTPAQITILKNAMSFYVDALKHFDIQNTDYLNICVDLYNKIYVEDNFPKESEL